MDIWVNLFWKVYVSYSTASSAGAIVYLSQMPSESKVKLIMSEQILTVWRKNSVTLDICRLPEDRENNHSNGGTKYQYVR